MSELLEVPRALEPGGVGAGQPATRGPTGLRWSSLPRPHSFFDWWITGLVAFGVAGRIAFYTAPFGVPDSDEAVGGLMAKDALHGHLTAFMWGQAYGGRAGTGRRSRQGVSDGLPVGSQSTRPIQRSRFSAYQRIVCSTPSSHETFGIQPVSRVSLSWPTRRAITSLAPGR